MTTLEKAARTICKELFGPFDSRELNASCSISAQSLVAARAAIESLRTPGIENTDRIFNAMLDRILREEV